MNRLALALALAASLAGCGSKKSKEAPAKAPPTSKTPTPTTPTPPPAAIRHDRLSRTDFNRLAAERALPLFWRADADGGVGHVFHALAYVVHEDSWCIGVDPGWVRGGQPVSGGGGLHAMVYENANNSKQT